MPRFVPSSLVPFQAWYLYRVLIVWRRLLLTLPQPSLPTSTPAPSLSHIIASSLPPSRPLLPPSLPTSVLPRPFPVSHHRFLPPYRPLLPPLLPPSILPLSFPISHHRFIPPSLPPLAPSVPRTFYSPSLLPCLTSSLPPSLPPLAPSIPPTFYSPSLHSCPSLPACLLPCNSTVCVYSVGELHWVLCREGPARPRYAARRGTETMEWSRHQQVTRCYLGNAPPRRIRFWRIVKNPTVETCYKHT